MYEANATDVPFSLLREVQEELFPAIIQDLHPFYLYQLRVAAVTVEPGPFSDLIDCTMPEDGMPICMCVREGRYIGVDGLEGFG